MIQLLLHFLASFDEKVIFFFSEAHTPLRTASFFIITHFADTLVVLCFILLFIVVLRNYYNHQYILPLVLCVSGSALSSLVLKFLFERARPENAFYIETFPSFPSGHATIALALYGFISWFFLTRVKREWLSILGSVFFIVLAMLIGISRVYLGVHYQFPKGKNEIIKSPGRFIDRLYTTQWARYHCPSHTDSGTPDA